MSSYAIVSDIHGNFSELTKIWGKLHDLGLTNNTIFNAGDTVAYGEKPAQCIDFLRSQNNVISVGGNYDYLVAEYPRDRLKLERKWLVSRPEKLDAIRAASAEIVDGEREWLRALPKLLELCIDGKSVALCHYSPVGKKVGLGSWTSDAELLTIGENCSYDIVITGHTHTPFVREVGSTLFINPGSVGRSWGNPTFAVMTIGNGRTQGELIE